MTDEQFIKPKAGDVVEYLGQRVTVLCKCNTGKIRYDYGRDRSGFLNLYTNRMAPDRSYEMCKICNEWFFYGTRNPLMEQTSEQPATTCASIAHLLPDVYGRKEHAKRLAREHDAQVEQEYHKHMQLGEKLGAIMDRHCGKARIDEPVEEPRLVDTVQMERRQYDGYNGLSPEYLAMVRKVNAVDSEAAAYLLDEAPRRADFDDFGDGDLEAAFIWDDTPQGLKYWKTIHDKISG